MLNSRREPPRSRPAYADLLAGRLKAGQGGDYPARSHCPFWRKAVITPPHGGSLTSPVRAAKTPLDACRRTSLHKSSRLTLICAWRWKESGQGPTRVAKLTVIVVDHDMSKLEVLTRNVVAMFGDTLPAQTLVPVPRLAVDPMLFEVEAVVILD